MKNLKELFELPVEEKIHLVNALWDSITLDTSDYKIPQSQIDESLRRLNEYKQNPERAISLEELKRRLNERLGR